MIKRISVFCGSSFGTEDIYKEQAYALGQKMAQKNIGLVYGGANVGLMGTVANAVLEHKGEAIGVLPQFLKRKEIAHAELTQFIEVETMHERKTKMNELSDAVIALPGGFGTLEEVFEMITWGQLGLHKKPVAFLNTGGFYDDLLKMIQNMVDKGFLKAENQKAIIVHDSIDRLLEKIDQYIPQEVPKWISKEN